MAAGTYSDIYDILKHQYPEQDIFDLTFNDHVWAGLIPKGVGMLKGRTSFFPIKYAPSNSRSALFVNTQSPATLTGNFLPKYEAWEVADSDICKNYHTIQIDGLTLELLAGDEAAFLSKVRLLTDEAFQSLGADISRSLFGDGTGLIGTLSSVSGSYDIVLTDPAQAVNFEVSMSIAGCDSTYSATADWYGNVTAVDISTGTVSITKVGGSQVPDATYCYMFQNGDNFAASSFSKFFGFEAWIPSAAPGATAFLGVARNVHSRLGGCRLDASLYGSRAEAIMKASVLCKKTGNGRPDLCIMGPDQFMALAIECASNPRFDVLRQGSKGPITASIGFNAIQVIGATGVINCVMDRDCPSTLAYLVRQDEWLLASTVSGCPFIDTIGGSNEQRLATVDGMEFRAKAYAQTICFNPGGQCRIKMPTL